MKNFILVILLLASSTLALAQNNEDQSTTDKATRIYVGYYGIIGPESHYGPSLYLSVPFNNTKLRLGVFGRSAAWGIYESRGGFLQISKLMSDVESNLRFRINSTLSYSVENLVGESELPHKMLALTVGGSVVYDVLKNLNIECGAGLGMASMVKLPKSSLFNPDKANVALQLSIAVSYRF